RAGWYGPVRTTSPGQITRPDRCTRNSISYLIVSIRIICLPLQAADLTDSLPLDTGPREGATASRPVAAGQDMAGHASKRGQQDGNNRSQTRRTEKLASTRWGYPGHRIGVRRLVKMLLAIAVGLPMLLAAGPVNATGAGSTAGHDVVLPGASVEL